MPSKYMALLRLDCFHEHPRRFTRGCEMMLEVFLLLASIRTSVSVSNHWAREKGVVLTSYAGFEGRKGGDSTVDQSAGVNKKASKDDD
jgi:hypothetical protein